MSKARFASAVRPAGARPNEPAISFRNASASNKISLEFEFARWRAKARSNAIVRHGNDPGEDSQGRGDLRGYLGERRALAQTLSAIEMRREIAIAELEPYLGAKTAESLKTMELVAADTPAALGVSQACQSIRNGIQIGRYVKTVDVSIIGGIADDKDAFGREHASESVKKASSSYAAGESHYQTTAHR